MWTFPLVILLIWWLKPSGLAVRRGLDIAIVSIFAIIATRILAEPLLPTSLDPFRWSIGPGWIPIPDAQQLQIGQESWAEYHLADYGVSVRPSLVFEHANTLGFVAAFMFVYGLGRGKKLGWGIAALALPLLVSSTSRTSLVAAFAGALVLAYVWFWSTLTSHRRRKGLLIAGALALTVPAVTLFVRRPNLTGRTAQWEAAIGTIDPAVFTGQGGEAWVPEVVSLQPTVGTQLHNSFLSGLAWGGLMGFTLLGALWVLGAVLAFRAVKAGNLASLALFATCLVLSMTESTFAYRYWSMGNALLLAAVLLSQWRPSEIKAPPTELDAQTAALPSEPLQTRQPK